MDNSQLQPPTYTDADLAKLSPADLTDILIENLDYAPRNVIDACARHGDAMTEHLHQMHEDDFLWKDNEDEPEEITDGKWWLRLHAVMILGLIPSEQAGLLLVELMRRMSLEDDDNLQDWLAGFWCAQFANKPDSVLPALRTLCDDRNMDWYMRANAVDPLIAAASRQGGEALEQTLAWLATNSADESEDWEYRLTSAALLLHFPRPQYRKLLDELAALQSGWDMHFDKRSIDQAYAGKFSAPEWERFKNPLQFYEPDAITKRQLRWQDEDEREKQRILSGVADYPNTLYDPYYDHEPYIRPEPKIGRNDPCPCGSGKKYKKCCMVNE